MRGREQRETAAGGEAVTLDEMTAELKQLESAIKQKGYFYAHAGIHVYGDGGHSLTVNGIGYETRLEQRFEGRSLSELLDVAGRWLARDELAELNATLGLTSDGRLVAGSAAQ